jgi:hypothetical protein
MVALAAFGLTPADVLAELEPPRRPVGPGRICRAQGPATRRRSLMNDVVIPAGQTRPHEGLRTLTHILYGLHT